MQVYFDCLCFDCLYIIAVSIFSITGGRQLHQCEVGHQGTGCDHDQQAVCPLSDYRGRLHLHRKRLDMLITLSHLPVKSRML